ncbi:MAG: long-chain fatty acid--CoA ligase [Acidimicrobiia bacterium]|nr:long-chain fatty acid--CoA ligase [Acidimicrobiia bacterium]
MQEYSSPVAVEVDPNETVPDGLWEAERNHPNRAALAYRDGEGFVDVSTKELADRVRRIAAGFMAAGIEKGDRICLFSSSRREFTEVDYAIWAAGCATVTIYETSSSEQVEWIVKDSGATAIVCENDRLVAVFNERAGTLGTVKHVYSIESGGLDALVEAGAAISDDEVMARAASVDQVDLATLVYTSGTTGLPKGCHLTHRNFVFIIRNVASDASDVLYAGASTLMFLPLAHIFARLVQVGSVNVGSKIAFSTGIPQLMEELQMVKPTWIFSVPRVFEKVYNSSAAKAADDGKGKIFDIAAQTAIDFAKQREAGAVGLATRLKHMVFDKLVYAKIRAALGGRAAHAISGGAPLGERLGYFYSGVGLKVYEGYGLTETSAGSTLNRQGAMKIGTVGRPISGVSIRIAEDGEVLIAGPHVFSGYWNNDGATSEAIKDGWFHTGDIGALDDEGFLRITGRKKEIIVTAGGKNVAPAVLEDRLRAHPLVSQCVVVGDAQPFIAVMVTIDPDEFVRWKGQHDKQGDIHEFVDDVHLREEIQAAIQEANNAVSKAEAIKEFRILPADFTIEGGEITPTLKVKRNVVHDKYGHVLADIYRKK